MDWSKLIQSRNAKIMPSIHLFMMWWVH